MAKELASYPDEVATRVRESIERFRNYDNIDEPFCPRHDVLTLPSAILDGRSLAAALTPSPNTVQGNNPFSFTLVDYEVPPARTTKNSRFMLNRFEDGRASTSTMSIDLLLRHEDGTLIVGEAKVAKIEGYDTDSVLALVQ
ncbi:MAG TPA: hypothetical protein VMZ33_01665, partial [Candidatus Limnocylindrales bacterium]|nr:hypothetical protein [Candidatus Limnocylindrales bacterium]